MVHENVLRLYTGKNAEKAENGENGSDLWLLSNYSNAINRPNKPNTILLLMCASFSQLASNISSIGQHIWI